jgi:BMFP domain-containing protein YqiC
MIDPKMLDDLAERLAATLPGGVEILQEDLKKNLRAILESGLAKLDLVTREEFEVQAAVLGRTREKLEQLETALKELENSRS